MAVRVGRWDCTTCGQRGIRGPETRCPGCGASRPTNVRFYLPTDAEEVTEESELTRARAGVDWICGHCHSQNKASDGECRACGNPRDASSEDVDLQEREYAPGEVPMSTVAEARRLHPDQQPASRKRPRRRWRVLGVILLLGSIALAGMIPVGTEARVEGFRWERSLQMLHREAVQKEAWQTPSGAFEVESFRAIHHYDKVFRGYETRTRTERVQVGTRRVVCGTIDRGNGYFEDRYCDEPIYESRQVEYQEEVYDEVPVYQTKYRFRVWEWVAREQYLLRSSGQDQAAKWPSQDQYAGNSDFKEGKRSANYSVILSEPNGTRHQEVLPENRWAQLSRGDRLPAKKAWLYGWWYGLE